LTNLTETAPAEPETPAAAEPRDQPGTEEPETHEPETREPGVDDSTTAEPASEEQTAAGGVAPGEPGEPASERPAMAEPALDGAATDASIPEEAALASVPDEPASAAASEPAATAPPAEMMAALEAILFVAGEPLSRERLLEVFEPGEREDAGRALDAVLERHRSAEGRGIMAEEVGGGVRLVSRPELHGYVRRFFAISGRGRLSMAALETLAIIAYRQPLTGPEVAELRGVQSGAVIKTLLERRLIRIAGRKQVVGKPFLYATTREFLLHFGLGSLSDLPPLEEMEDFFAAEGGGEAPAPPDREEEVERAAAALDAREEAREAEGDGEGEP
jgi:segregation and condensation protein B